MPAVDLTLLKDKVFLSGTLVGGVMFAMLMAVTFLLPVFMQEMLGYSALQSGLALMPRALTMLVVTPIVGRLYNKIQPRIVVAFGIVCFAVSAWQMSHYTLQSSTSGIISTLILQGVGFSCLWVPLATVALVNIKRHKLADATGLNSLVRQIGGSVGLAAFATLLPRFSTQIKTALSAHVTAGRPEVTSRFDVIVQMLHNQGFDLASAQMAARRILGGIVTQQAMVMTFEKLFLLAGIAFLCVMPLLIFLKAPKVRTTKVDAHVEM